jgi:hypothetical protein
MRQVGVNFPFPGRLDNSSNKQRPQLLKLLALKNETDNENNFHSNLAEWPFDLYNYLLKQIK